MSPLLSEFLHLLMIQLNDIFALFTLCCQETKVKLNNLFATPSLRPARTIKKNMQGYSILWLSAIETISILQSARTHSGAESSAKAFILSKTWSPNKRHWIVKQNNCCVSRKAKTCWKWRICNQIIMSLSVWDFHALDFGQTEFLISAWVAVFNPICQTLDFQGCQNGRQHQWWWQKRCEEVTSREWLVEPWILSCGSVAV